jgi:hypothetical protein
LGHEFCASFSGTETSGLTKTSETHTEVSVEREPENFPKFRAKMNYCVEECGHKFIEASSEHFNSFDFWNETQVRSSGPLLRFGWNLKSIKNMQYFYMARVQECYSVIENPLILPLNLNYL